MLTSGGGCRWGVGVWGGGGVGWGESKARNGKDSDGKEKRKERGVEIRMDKEMRII